jgi:Zn finger protein HypA/HybF involved in hydrogenase expression
MAATTTLIKPGKTKCPACGGPTSVYGHANSENVIEQFDLKCMKCGEILYRIRQGQPPERKEETFFHKLVRRHGRMA